MTLAFKQSSGNATANLSGVAKLSVKNAETRAKCTLANEATSSMAVVWANASF